MISLKQFLKNNLLIFVTLLLAGYIVTINAVFMIVSDNQYQREVEREYDALNSMIGHLSTEGNNDALVGYLTHYTHINNITIAVKTIDDTTLFSNDDTGEITEYETVLYENEIVAYLGVNFDTSNTLNERLIGFVIINTISLVFFSIIFLTFNIYVGKWTARIKNDILNLNKENSNLSFKEFHHLKEQLDQKNALIESQKRVYQSHIQSLAHDIKTPLTVIDLYTESLIEQKMPLNLNVIEDIRDESFRIASIVPKIIQTNMDDLSYYQDISIHISNFIKKYKDVFMTKNIELLVRLEPLFITISTQDLTRLVEHLVFNAFYYSYSNSTVRIETSQKSHSLSVIDHGIGMSKETIQKILNGNYRAIDAAKFHSTGTGIGYKIITEILNRLNASIEIKSEIGQGSTIIVTFDLY